MGKLLGLTPKIPGATPATPTPQSSDQQIRDAKLKQIADLDKTAGAGANTLTESRLGDYSKAATRSGAMPSQIVSGNSAAA